MKLKWTPRKVFLFSGHMIDAPGRETARFAKEMASIVADTIRNQLKALNAGSEDLAVCSGACGGDLIFAEASLKLKLHIYIPFAVPEFLQKSVSFAGDNWQERFYTVIDHPLTSLYIMPEELGELPADINPYEHSNLWLLDSAIARWPEKVHCICLWDGKGGDGSGGTRHMHNCVKKYSDNVYILDAKKLFDTDTQGN